MAKIIFFEQAEKDQEDILTYLFLNAGIRVVGKYNTAFKECFRLLASNPEIGTARHRLGPVARIQVVDPYIVVYDYFRIDDEVHILRIVHGKRRISARLLKGTDRWDA